MQMMTSASTTLIVKMVMVDDDDEDDDDDDAVAAPLAGQALAGPLCLCASGAPRSMPQGAFTKGTGPSASDPETLPLERAAHALLRGRQLEEPLRELLRGHLQWQPSLRREGRGPGQLPNLRLRTHSLEAV